MTITSSETGPARREPFQTVLWISGESGYGKSHLAALLEGLSASVFDTDQFVTDLPQWCPDPDVAHKAAASCPRDIGGFFDAMVAEKKAAYLAQLLLDPEHGIRVPSDLLVVVGYLPLVIQHRVIAALETRGVFVWVTMRSEQYDQMCGFAGCPLTSKGAPAAVSSYLQYLKEIFHVRQVVQALVPAGAAVIVASRGDEELLQFEGRNGWHFLQTDNGVYAGHYPGDSTDAVAQLEALREKGSDYFLLPNLAFWWLDTYPGLRHHLERCADCLHNGPYCRLYHLGQAPPGPLLRLWRWLTGVRRPRPAAL
jgi:hypothetical protein